MTALLELDARLTAALRIAEKPGLLRKMAVLLAHSGDSWLWLTGLLLVVVFVPGEWRTRAVIMIAAIVVGAAIVMVIKFSVRRQRPPGEWGAIYRSTDPHSFPSGHAARAVMLAVLAAGLGPAWFAGLLAVWAPLVALARVAMGVHYLSDVVAGGILGAVMGALAVWLSAVWLL